ncbi:ABC transporter permease [Cyanobium sp. HWJ4-Hawea]|uniref:ABC transporter permease n=1 Tax=Cyanobium sp. HWJ4-Hawea TaxID=2823713 RepID=UPI0020CBAE25|nr:ABC transporter permease [Cyanobium sp. HWJ4-Hawea]MCP9810104.1 ABC transporter permease [Cyanobium sp. HWJ4-Hawea]
MASFATNHQKTSVLSTLREAWALRRVWWFTATARTRARFARTLFGSFWLGFSNLFSIAVLAIVYGTVFKVQDFKSYVVYLGLGLTIWNSIAAAIGNAPNLFEHNARHVHNTNVNPIFYTLEEWAFQVQTFLQSFLMVLIALSLFQATLIPHFLMAGWLPLLNLLLFLYWLPALVCLLGARYRDIYQLVPIVLQLVFLLSPILYQKKNLGTFAWTADLNPIYHILSPFRHSIIAGSLLGGHDFVLLVVNLAGIWWVTWLINRERRWLPFLI